MNYSKVHFKKTLLIILLTITGLAAGAVVAEEGYQLAKKLRQEGKILPLEKILAIARTQKPGEVLETEFEKKDGHYLYEVEILDAKGQVWELKLNAKTGQIIKIELDD